MHEESLGFNDLNLSFGQIIEAFPQKNASRDFSPVVLLGAIPDESLIISAPPSGEFPVMQEGEKVVFRVNLPEGIALFAANVLFISDVPFLMVYVDFPSEIRFKKIRQAARVSVSLPVLLSNQTTNKQTGIAGKIADISTVGAGLEAYEFLGEVGHEVSLKGKFTIGQIQRVLSIRAVIRKCKQTAAGHFVYGVEFLEKDENDLLVLFGFIFNAMAFGTIQKVR